MGCVYALAWEQTPKVYVGVDTRDAAGRARLHHHLSEARKGRGALLHRAIRKHGAPRIIVLFRSDDDALLMVVEEELIDELGTMAPHGYNLQAGGQGGRPAPEVKARISATHLALWQDPEHRAKMVASRQPPPAAPTCSPHQLGAWIEPPPRWPHREHRVRSRRTSLDAQEPHRMIAGASAIGAWWRHSQLPQFTHTQQLLSLIWASVGRGPVALLGIGPG